MNKNKTKSETPKELKVGAVPLKEIRTNGNVRIDRSRTEDAELLASVKDVGVVQPVVLRKNPKGGGYLLVAGHRRFDAAKGAGLKMIPARVLNLDEETAHKVQLTENLHRQDLNPIEKAEALKQELDRLIPGGWQPAQRKALPGSAFKAAVKAVALSFSLKEREVYKHLRLLELPAKVKAWLRAGRLLPAHGALLLTVPSEKWEAAQEFVEQQLGSNLKEDRSFSVESLARWVGQNLHRDLANAPFPVDRELGGEIACTACPFNTGNQGTLFSGAVKGRCSAPKCFTKKKRAFLAEEKARMAQRFKGLEFIGFAGAVGKWNSPGNSNTPEAIKGRRIVERKDMDKALMKALKTHPKAFGWAIVKPSQCANVKPYAVYTIEKPEVLEQAGALRAAKQDSQGHENRENLVRLDPKARFIGNYYSERIAETLHDAVQKAKVATIMDYAIENFGPMLGEDREFAAFGVTKGGKRANKATPEVLLRSLVLTDAWGNGIEDRTLKQFGVDPKAVKKTWKADAEKAWKEAEKGQTQANETEKEAPGEKK